jgi:transmembrane sensor
MPKKTRNETAKQIDAAAADWAARLDRGVLSPDDEARLDAWLAEDARRVGAFAKARAVAMYADRARALGAQFDPRKFQSARASTFSPARRRMLWGAAAGVGGLVAAGYGLQAAAGEVYTTRRGEMRVVPLADGSIVNLNTDSRIKVRYTRTRRTIHLDRGEVLFDVAKDGARPFVVYAGDTEVKAVGTSFSVQRLADAPVQVVVREGIVEVDRAGLGGAMQTTPSTPIRLTANMRATAPALESFTAPVPIRAIAIAPVEVERAVAWRDGRIAFEGETLAEAVKDFQRYSDTRIVIDDPSIAGEEVTGLFQATDPVGFARAVATSFGLRAEVGDNQVTLSR